MVVHLRRFFTFGGCMRYRTTPSQSPPYQGGEYLTLIQTSGTEQSPSLEMKPRMLSFLSDVFITVAWKVLLRLTSQHPIPISSISLVRSN